MHCIRSVAYRLVAVLLLLVFVTGAAAASENTPAENICEQALAIAQEGDLDAAIAIAEAGLESFPNSTELYMLLGNMHYSVEQYPEAYEAYHHAAIIDPENYEHFLCEADALYYQALFDEAIVSYDKAIELNPDMGYLYGCRGDAYYVKGEYEKASEDYDREFALGERSSESVIRRAFVQEALARDVPFPQEGRADVIINFALYNDLLKYFDSREISCKELMMSYMLHAKMSGLTCESMLFPELNQNDDYYFATYWLHNGAWIDIPFSDAKLPVAYILYQRYDAPLYQHAAKFADVFLATFFGDEVPVSYDELKRAQFVQRQWEPICYKIGEYELTLYFMENMEAMLIEKAGSE